MKRLLLFTIFLVSLTIVSGCSKNENESLSLTPDEFNLYTEEIKTATASKDVSWSSEDEFVATIDEAGEVTAQHVGSTIIKAKATAGNGSGTINMNVIPKYHTYEDPLFLFGESKQKIKNRETNKIQRETDNVLYYATSNPYILRMYSFDSNRLKGVAVTCSWSFALEVMNFLLERYMPIGSDNDEFFFINNFREKANMSIMYSTDTQYDFVMIAYMSYSALKMAHEEENSWDMDYLNKYFAQIKEAL